MPKYMGNINFGKKVNIGSLENLIKSASKKYSIRVGIIGEKATQIHEGTNLTNAQLGAAHEFGATINNPGGQPYIILENGQARFVKKDSEAGRKAIREGRVTKPHTITLPARSFLRMPLLGSEAKKEIIKSVLDDPEFKYDEFLADYVKTGKKPKDEYVKAWQATLKKHINEDIISVLPIRIGGVALERVQEAFKTGGFGKWASITNYTKQHRKGDSSNPPLDDLGNLKDSIAVEIKEV